MEHLNADQLENDARLQIEMIIEAANAKEFAAFEDLERYVLATASAARQELDEDVAERVEELAIDYLARLKEGQ